MINGMNQLLPIVLIGFIIVFGAMYFSSSMACLDAGTDLNGSNYEGAYDSATESTILSMSMITIVMYLIGAAALIAGVWMLMSLYGGRS